VILNPDHVICHLDEGAEIRMEFTVNTGKATSRPSATVPRTRRSG
jgi:RNA polymerase Rpb3/RpoA insert domain.